MTPRDTRREENQKLFRAGNERLRHVADERVPNDGRVPFLCECADESCNGRIELRLDEWEGVASRPRHYIMIGGHPRSEGEEVVGSVAEYDIVRKPG